eukprot:TRINITY_DN15742_c0_g1_i1.p1 TRINITY_DN15742_c0_g1~~TRINITY_DN15742_c0_g1_i1.p1  ORF type:complete len:417 (-),score=106.85 TRINITY_DN15742_c0_g1_i1:86-1336(-)
MEGSCKEGATTILRQLRDQLPPDHEFWKPIFKFLQLKQNEFNLYERHLWNQNSAEYHSYSLPVNGMFEVIPVEISMEIFKFVPIIDLVRNVARVNQTMKAITAKDNQPLWKSVLVYQWKNLVERCFKDVKIEEIEPGMRRLGYCEVAKTLIFQTYVASQRSWKIIRDKQSQSQVYYAGEWEDNKREGYGILKLIDGTTYEGEWKKNKREGHGIEQRTDGSRYEGGWVNNNRCGYGVGKTASGSIYEGEWKEDKREGYGTGTSDAFQYKGEWKGGVPNGHGLETLTTGGVYNGGWKSGRREGRGVEELPTGESYNGEWKKNKREGQGVAKYQDGSIYEGGWKNSKKEGRGVMRYIDGRVYKGEFSGDEIEGRGEMKYEDGTIYEGEFKQGKREGRGVEKKWGEAIYDGQWKNDEKIK